MALISAEPTIFMYMASYGILVSAGEMISLVNPHIIYIFFDTERVNYDNFPFLR